jgi:hypothetical protein
MTEGPNGPIVPRTVALVRSAAAALFFGAIFGLLSQNALGWYQSDRQLYAQRRARERSHDMVPNLSRVLATRQVPPIERLILEPIGWYVPGPAHAQLTPVSSTETYTVLPPESISYTVGYDATEERAAMPGWRAVEVEVREYPNEAWARFEVRERYDLEPDPDHAYVITKFGSPIGFNRNSVLMKTGEYVYWISGSRLISIHTRDADPAQFIRRYLQKYPSNAPR